MTVWDSRDDYKGLGTHSDREYNDLDGVQDLTNLPDDAFHRNVDKVVLEAGHQNSDVLKTVIVCPPTIYGKSDLVLNSTMLMTNRQGSWNR